MILSDGTIRELSEQGMITPFIDECVRRHFIEGSGYTKVLSYGLSSGGYDVRLDTTFRVFSNLKPKIIDPKRFHEDCLVEIEATVEGTESFIVIPPNTYALGLTIESFNIPRDVMVTVLGKSTLARAGIIVNVTPIEPGFCGRVVIELANTTPLPCKVYAGEGVAQFIFHRLDKPCEVSYDDRKGKYQNQSSLVLPKV